MTISLTVTNRNDPSTGRVATIKKLNVDENGDSTDVPAESVDLAPGESADVTIYSGRELLILEK